MRAQEKILSRDELVLRVFGNKEHVSRRTIDVHVASLRKKLGKAGNLLQTVRGIGYRLDVIDH